MTSRDHWKHVHWAMANGGAIRKMPPLYPPTPDGGEVVYRPGSKKAEARHCEACQCNPSAAAD